MSFRHYRIDDGFHYGWTGDRYWLSICGHRGTICLDVGPFRIRWAGPNHRPLFSERYGYQKWHGIGRLKVNRAKRTKVAK